MSKEPQTVQSGSVGSAPEQIRPHAARLARTPSISSQSSLESSASRTVKYNKIIRSVQKIVKY